MSADEKAAKDLVETLRDGRDGFASAAEKLRDGDRAEVATTMSRFSEQRAGFARQIVEMGHDYGDEVDESGSAAASLHRGWLALKDAVTGDDGSGVISAVLTGEEHAVSEYEKALEEDLSDGFRAVVREQYAAVCAARDEVRALQPAG